MKCQYGTVTVLLLLLFAYEIICATENSDSVESNSNAKLIINETELSEPIKYTPINVDTIWDYKSDKVLDKRNDWMDTFIRATNSFIDLIQSKEIVPDGLIDEKEDKINWSAGDIINHFLGPIILMAVILVIALIVPLINCCICCFGRKKDPYEAYPDYLQSDDVEKNLCLRKFIIGTLLLLLFVLLMLGLLAAVVSNLMMHKGIDKLPDFTDSVVRDIRLFVHNTFNEIKALSQRNFDELTNKFLLILDNWGSLIMDKLMKFMNLNDLKNLKSNLTYVEDKLQIVVDQIKNFSNSAQSAEQKYETDIRDPLLKIIAENSNHFQGYKNKVPKELIKQEELNKLSQNKMNNTLDKLKKLITHVSTIDLYKTLNNIKAKVQKKIDEKIPEAKTSINNTKLVITNFYNEVHKNLNNKASFFTKNYTEPAKISGLNVITKYTPYSFTIGLIFCCIVLLVTVFVLFVAFCGMCSTNGPKRNDKNCTAYFVATCVWMIFIIMSILMILDVPLISVGIASERVVCETLQNPANSKLFSYAEKKLNLAASSNVSDITLAAIMKSCHKNDTILRVLKQENSLMGEINSQKNKKIEIVDNAISDTDLGDNNEFISQQGIEDLRRNVKDVEVENGELNVTRPNIDWNKANQTIQDFNGALEKLPANDNEIRTNLQNILNDLNKFFEEDIGDLKNLYEQLFENVDDLMNEKNRILSIKENTTNIIDRITSLQQTINNNTSDLITNITSSLVKSLKGHINGFFNHANTVLKNDLGKCGPLSNIYNATITVGCGNIIDPLNGFCLSFLWCLILLIPAMYLSVKSIAVQNLSTIRSVFLADKKQKYVDITLELQTLNAQNGIVEGREKL